MLTQNIWSIKRVTGTGNPGSDRFNAGAASRCKTNDFRQSTKQAEMALYATRHTPVTYAQGHNSEATMSTCSLALYEAFTAMFVGGGGAKALLCFRLLPNVSLRCGLPKLQSWFGKASACEFCLERFPPSRMTTAHSLIEFGMLF